VSGARGRISVNISSITLVRRQGNRHAVAVLEFVGLVMGEWGWCWEKGFETIPYDYVTQYSIGRSSCCLFSIPLQNVAIIRETQ
jgi:hypothetical protein